MATNQEKLDLAYTRAEAYLDLPTSKVPARVWDETVLRGGKRHSVKQELANGVSGIQRLEASVAALTSLVGQLAKGQAIDYDRIKSDMVDALENGALDVNVSFNEKDAA